MTGAWQAVIVVLTLLVLIEAVLILSLYRQFGEIYLGQRDARSRDGLPVSSRAPSWDAFDVAEDKRTSRAFLGRALALVFVEPSCGPCKQLLTSLGGFARDHAASLAVAVAGASDEIDNKQMVQRYELALPVLTQREQHLAALFNVTATPFVHVIDEEGLIRAKGIVNTRAQLEEMVAPFIHAPSQERVIA